MNDVRVCRARAQVRTTLIGQICLDNPMPGATAPNLEAMKESAKELQESLQAILVGAALLEEALYKLLPEAAKAVEVLLRCF